MVQDSFYTLRTRTLEGKETNLNSFAGQVTLVVNVASECGFTPQYKGLEALHAQFQGRGFSVLGFPSNDFGGQEPGTPEEIRSFCSTKYKVSFPLFEKVVTKAGPGQSPIYAHLQAQAKSLPDWNFCKYLVGKDGRVLKFFRSKLKPDDAGLRKEIEDALR
jgi:glutathione peroxidase